jgi:hypothetical protein
MGSKSRLLFKPVDPFQGGELDRVERAPWSAPMNDLGFVEAVDGLGQGVVIAVADAADRGFDPGLGEALGVLDADVLRAAVRVMDQAAMALRPPFVQGLLQRVENEAGMGGAADAPADNPPGIGVDDEGDVHKPRPGGDIGEVLQPQPVGRRRVELAVHVVERTGRGFIADRGAHGLAPDHPLQAKFAHQPLHGPAGRLETLSPHLPPDLAHAVDGEVLGEDPGDLWLEGLISAGPRRKPRGIASLSQALAVGRRGDRRNLADRLDPVSLSMLVDKTRSSLERTVELRLGKIGRRLAQDLVGPAQLPVLPLQRF